MHHSGEHRRKTDEGLQDKATCSGLPVQAVKDYAIFMLDAEGRIISGNYGGKLVEGYEKEEIVGRHFSCLCPGAGGEQFSPEEVLKSARDTGRFEREGWRIRKDGTKFWGHCVVTALADDAGTVQGFAMITQDLTERRRAERRLKESEKRYRALIETINEGLVVTDSRAKMTYVNNKFAEMLGYSVAEVSGKSAYDMVHESNEEILAQHLAKRRTGEVVAESYELVLRHKDGRQVPVILSARAVFDERGQFQGSLATCVDITERKKTEEALRRLATAVDQSVESIIITDKEGSIQYVNPAFEAITGYSKGEAIGKNPRFLRSEAHDRAFYKDMLRTIRSGEAWKGRIVSKRKDGTLFREDVTISPVRDASGEIVNYVDVGHDVTQQVELEKQLLQAQKMEAVGTLAGGVAHDFNNLLQVVLGFTELLLADKKADEPGHEELQRIFQAARRGAELVERLLAFSRRTDNKRRPLNLNREVERVGKLLSRTIPKMIDIEVHLADGLNIVNADPAQVEQVLMNLGVNAKDAMPEGGRLIIRTANVFLDESYCAIHPGLKPGKFVRMTVSDTGQGMDKTTLEHIFEPFYTTKEPGYGTGLGLAMVYGIVSQHGGYVSCYSEPGRGARFEIYLPVIEMQAEREVSRVVELPEGGTETILLVDDEEFIRDLGTRLLTRAGYSVLTAATGQEALDLYARNSETIGLTVMDMIMPGMAGKRCMAEILKIDPRAKVIIASGFAVEELSKEAIDTGARGFVHKPYDMRKFLEIVREVLDSD